MATNCFHPNCRALLPHPRRGGEALDLLGSPMRNSAALATRVSPTCRGLYAHRAAHSARQPSTGPRCCSSPKTPAIASSTCIDPTFPADELIQALGIRLVRRRRAAGRETNRRGQPSPVSPQRRAARSSAPTKTRGSIHPDPLSNRFDLAELRRNLPAAGRSWSPSRCRAWSIGWRSRARAMTRFAGRSASCWRRTAWRCTSLRGPSAAWWCTGITRETPVRSRRLRWSAPPGTREASTPGQQVFNDLPFQFPPALYNHLATPQWSHWGSRRSDSPDYPVHAVIGIWQELILSQLLSPLTLARLHDSELKVPADKDAFTTAELLQRLTKAILRKLDSCKRESSRSASRP